VICKEGQVRIEKNTMIHLIVDLIAEAAKREESSRTAENPSSLVFEKSSLIFHKHMLANTFLNFLWGPFF